MCIIQLNNVNQWINGNFPHIEMYWCGRNAGPQESVIIICVLILLYMFIYQSVNNNVISVYMNIHRFERPFERFFLFLRERERKKSRNPKKCKWWLMVCGFERKRIKIPKRKCFSGARWVASFWVLFFGTPNNWSIQRDKRQIDKMPE